MRFLDVISIPTEKQGEKPGLLYIPSSFSFSESVLGNRVPLLLIWSRENLMEQRHVLIVTLPDVSGKPKKKTLHSARWSSPRSPCALTRARAACTAQDGEPCTASTRGLLPGQPPGLPKPRGSGGGRRADPSPRRSPLCPGWGGGARSLRFGDTRHATLRWGTAGPAARTRAPLPGWTPLCALLNPCSTKRLLPQTEGLHDSPRGPHLRGISGLWPRKQSSPPPHLFVLCNR